MLAELRQKPKSAPAHILNYHKRILHIATMWRILRIFAIMKQITKALQLTGLFHLNINLRNAAVLHALELAEGGGTAESVAAGGDAVVVEEV